MTGRRRAGLIVCVLIAAITPAFGASETAQTPRDRSPAARTGTSVIEGRVVVLVNGQPTPVRRARVTLDSVGAGRTSRVDTDVDGRFQFTSLPAGSYRVIVEKAGFVLFVRDPRRAFERLAPIDVAAGAAVTLELMMQRGAAIEGTIVTETGDPAINVVVSAQRFAYDGSGRHLVSVQQARTDDRGRFRVHTLPPGDYYLDAGPDPIDLATRGGGAGTILAHTLYPGGARIDDARPISLTVGQDVDGMNFTLTRIAVSSVRGRVVPSSGQPVKDVAVRIQRVGGPVGEVRGSLNPDGNDFVYPLVPPGEYWLMGVTKPSPGADFEYGAQRITVAGVNLTNIVVTTEKGASIAGRVEVDGGAAPLPADLQIVAYDTEFTLPPMAGEPAVLTTAPVDPSGAFKFASLFGPRIIGVDHLPTKWAVKSIALDDADITDSGSDFRGADRAKSMRVVITPVTASVRGVVQDESGKAAAGVRVVVCASDEHQWRPRSRFVRAAESASDGRYAIDGLLGGSYLIAAVPYLEDGSWTDAAVLRGLRDASSPLALKNGEAATLALKVKK